MSEGSIDHDDAEGLDKDVHQLLSAAGDHYRQALRSSPQAIAYLRRRGISGAIAARFGLGYARSGWQDLAPVLSGHTDPVVRASGLVARGGGSGYDRFRDRIMFPIRDAAGQTVGFGGRALDDTTDPKYLNSPESSVFKKRSLLYGQFEAREAIASTRQCLVVEGYVDVISLAQAGIGNVVATLGTACTAGQLLVLHDLADELVFCFDGDAAGRRAAAAALEAVLPFVVLGATIKFAFLPDGHDPDSFVRQEGAGAFSRCIADAMSLGTFLLACATDGCDLAVLEGRVRAAARAGAAWRQLHPGAIADGLLAGCAQQLNFPAAALLQSWAPPVEGART